MISANHGILHSNPYDAYDNVHALALAAVVLEAPHAVRLLVPERLCCRVHAPASNVRLAVGRERPAVARCDVWLLRFALDTALGLAQQRRRNEVLHNGAVDDKLVRRSLGARGGRFRDDGFEDRVNNGRIPSFNFGVLVVFSTPYRALACIRGDLS